MRTGQSSLPQFDIGPFYREGDAYRFVERIAWPEGPVCPRCSGSGRVRPLQGHTTGHGTYKCYDCRRPFTVKIGTIFANSNVPMHKWLQAILLFTIDNRTTAAQLQRTLNVDIRTARYLLARMELALMCPKAGSCRSNCDRDAPVRDLVENVSSSAQLG